MPHFYIANIGWFLFGLLGLLISFYMTLSDNSSPKAVIQYMVQYPRIAIFNTFAYIFFVMMWLKDGFGVGLLPQGHLNYLTVPLAWVAATFFHQVIKNFSTFFGGILGKIFGIQDTNAQPPTRQP